MKERLPDLKDVSIVFATPVYLWNVTIAREIDKLEAEKKNFATVRQQYEAAHQTGPWEQKAQGLHTAADTIWQQRSVFLLFPHGYDSRGKLQAIVVICYAICAPPTRSA